MRYTGRAIVVLAILAFCIVNTAAVTYYVDGNCPSAGTGASIVCGATGPKTTIADGVALLSSGDDILNIRGVHSAHDGESADFDGRYSTSDQIAVNKNGTSGHPIIIQNYGYTGAGTGETVYVEGTTTPGAWTQCVWGGASCNAPCAGLTTEAICEGTWYVAGSGLFSRAIGAQKPDGAMTRRETSLAAVNAQFESYSAQTAATNIYVFWGDNSNCSGSGAPYTCCTGSGAGTCNPTQASNPKPYVFYDNNGFGFISTSASTFVTFRGLNVRCTKGAAYSFQNASDSDIIVQDGTIKYVADRTGNGSDYGVVANNSQRITVSNMEIAYTGSEGIHSQALTSGATVRTISDNWIHDLGDSTVMGPGSAGTPAGMILGDSGGGSGNGNYSGSVVSGNLIKSLSNGYGIILENVSSNWIIRDNIFDDISHSGLKLEATGGHSDSNQIFNNIFRDCGPNGTTGAALLLATGGGASAILDGNLIYNNTFIDNNADAIDETCNGAQEGKCTNNLIRNNIFYKSGSWLTQLVWNSTTTSNLFENNIVYGTNVSSNNAHKYLGVNYTCAQINSGSMPGTDNNKCADPLFTNTSNSDYHIQTASPAKDAGTSTGLPSAKTSDINNTIADDRGFPSYADGQAQSGSAWDMGADEFSTGGTVTLTISMTDSPDPVVPANNITYTLAYQNTGTTSATSVVIVDTIPANTSFVSATSSGTSNGTTVTWNIGTVTAGASGSVQMVVLVTSPLADGTIISNSTYSIDSTETAAVSGVTDTTTVTSLPVLQLSMSDAPDPVLAGSNITYTIFYSNTGTAGATNVVITDAVPINTTFVSATNSGSESGGTVTWSIGAVNAGTFGSVQMVVTASASLANGAQVTNSTYTLASSELSTINGTPISTGVVAAVTTIPQPKFPITSRQNGWVQTQTLLFDGAADLVQTPNGGQWIRGQASENLTLSTSGSTTDTSANLLPANSIIEAVVARVTTTITVATDWKLGDSAQGARFSSADSTMTIGETKVGLNHMNPTVATADLGPVQSSAAKVRVTTTGTPSAGAIRITVFYRQFIAPTN